MNKIVFLLHLLSFSQVFANEHQVPFDYDYAPVTVKAHIDDHPEMLFILDTGATANAITTYTAVKMGLFANRLDVFVALDQANGLLFNPETKVEIGNVKFDKSTTYIVDGLDDRLKGIEDEPIIAGILGKSVFQQYLTSLDFDKKTLTFSKFDEWQPNKKAIRLPITFDENGQPVVPFLVKGVPAKLLFDTGSNGGFSLYQDKLSKFAFSNNEFVSYQEVEVPALKSKVSIGDQEYSTLMRVLDIDSERKTWDGKLGIAFLRCFNIDINYHQKSVYLMPREGVDKCLLTKKTISLWHFRESH